MFSCRQCRCPMREGSLRCGWGSGVAGHGLCQRMHFSRPLAYRPRAPATLAIINHCSLWCRLFEMYNPCLPFHSIGFVLGRFVLFSKCGRADAYSACWYSRTWLRHSPTDLGVSFVGKTLSSKDSHRRCCLPITDSGLSE